MSDIRSAGESENACRKENFQGDHVIRAAAADLRIRAFAALTTETVETARTTHQLSKAATAALGRLLTGGAMMGAMMKGEKDLLTLSIRSDGPIGGMTVTADSRGDVKGFVRCPDADVPNKTDNPHKIDVGAAVGRGILTVTQDLGLKEPYSGQVALQTGEIGDDLAYYFTVSEQTPSAVGLGVKIDTDYSVRCAGGFLIQLMPDCPDDAIDALEKRIGEIRSVTDLLEQGIGPRGMLERILAGLNPEWTDEQPVRFHCGCSKEKFARALSTLSEKDLRDLLDSGEPVEVKCHFCGSAYTYSPDEMREILAQRKKDKAPAGGKENA